VPGDVFEKDPSQSWPKFVGNSCDIGPQVPLVIGSLALSCHAERLAGVSGKDGVDRAPEGLSVKGGDIIPDRGWREVSGPLGCDDGPAGVILPFDKASRVKTGFGEHEAQIKATGSGAEGDAVSGT
jgi:hypothetical protein